jgi:hypothetical protein
VKWDQLWRAGRTRRGHGDRYVGEEAADVDRGGGSAEHGDGGERCLLVHGVSVSMAMRVTFLSAASS